MKMPTRLLCALLGVFVSLSFIPVSNAQDYTSGLVGHWKMDETSGTVVVNSAGSNDGVMNGGLSASTDSVDGQIGAGLDFDGIDDNVAIPSTYDWAGGDFSVAFWIMIDTYVDYKRLFYIDDQFLIAYGDSGNRIAWSVEPDNVDGKVTVGDLLGVGVWTHVTLVYDKATTEGKFYINGVEQIMSNNDPALMNWDNTGYTDDTVFLMARDTVAEQDGKIDDVRMYNRALSAADTLALYQASRAGTLRYNDKAESLEYYDSKGWVHAGLGSYSPNAVNFDGTNDYLQLSANEGMSDSKMVTGSLWIRKNDTVTNFRPIESGSSAFNMYANSSGQYTITAENSSGPMVLNCSSLSNYTDQSWHHILFSFDLTNTSNRHLYIDGIDALSSCATYTDDIMNLDLSLRIGLDAGSTEHFDGDVADVWLESGIYIDFSVEANRRKFRSENGMPMMLGKNGSLPTSQAPDIFLSGDTVDWHKNKGTGGNFTENGEISDANTKPYFATWEQVGNSLGGIGGDDNGTATIGPNTIATFNSISDTLRTYSWNGTDWSQVGNGLSIPTSSSITSMANLEPNLIALSNSIWGEVRTYSWDGTDWSQIGNSTAIAGAGGATAALTNIQIAAVNDGANTLSTYNWDGTDWSQTGNSLVIPSLHKATITALNPTTIALKDSDSGGKRLRTYAWNGTDWSQTGNDFRSLDGGASSITSFSKNQISYATAADFLNTYSWNGTDWSQIGKDFLPTIGNYISSSALNKSTVVLNNHGTLQTYQFAHCKNPDRERGTMIFNSTFNLMQYCNGVDWVAMGEIGGTGSGCNDPSGAAGDMIYNEDYNIMQYCDSENWRGIGKNIYSLLDSGLVGHWKLDETSGTTAVDSSGYGRDGTMAGGLDAGNDSVTGILDDAFNFDGVDDAVQIPTITFSDTDEWTLSAWLFDEHSSGDGNWIGRNGVTTYFMVHNNGYWYRDSAGAYFEYVDSAGRASYTNRWALHTFVADGTGTIDFYIDGSLITTLSGIADSSLVFNRLGHAYYNANNAADVSMDDVRLWDRAFNTGEVSALYSLYVEPDITSGLVGHWPLDETSGAVIADVSGSGNNGAWTDGTGDDVAEETVSGIIQTAIDFDGTNDDINFGNDSSLDITDNTMTIAAWVKKSVSSEAGTMFYRGVDGSNGYQFSIGQSGCSSTQITFSKFNRLHGCFDGVPADTLWHHYAVVVGTTGMYSYVDGVLTDTNSDTRTINTSTQSASTRSNLSGSLDDLRVYGRALSEPDIALLYSTGQPGLSEGLVGHWKLDETTGSVIFDSSGNGNNGAWSDGSGNDVGEETVVAMVETGIDFDGSNDLVNLGNDASLQLIGDMSVSLWVNFDSLTTGQRILNYQAGGETLATNDLYSLALSSSSPYNDLVVGHENGAGINSGQASFDTNLSAGAWYHVALVRDSSNTQTSLYLNNTLISTSSYANNPDGGSAGSLYLGYDVPNSGAYDLDGKLDDVRIYNRMLSASDIQELYDIAPDPCDSSPTPGDVCKDGSVYAGNLSGTDLFVPPADDPAGIRPWNFGSGSGYTTTGATSATDGQSNTATIIPLDSDTNFPGTQQHNAPQLCADLTAHGDTDWYLPSIDELNVLYTNRVAIGGFNMADIFTGWYHSSTEASNSNVQIQQFTDGFQNSVTKNLSVSVRCVRQN